MSRLYILWILSIPMFIGCGADKIKTASENPEPTSFTCHSCGKEHLDTSQIGYTYPDAYVDLPQETMNEWTFNFPERPSRASWADKYFIRGVVEIPVKDRTAPFAFGLWVEVSKDLFKSLNREEVKEGEGTLNTMIACYPKTQGLPVKIIVNDDPQLQPLLRILDDTHPLAIEARDGMPLARNRDLLIGFGHKHAYNYPPAVHDLKTFQTPKFANFEEDRWTLQEAATLQLPEYTLPSAKESESLHLFEMAKLYFEVEYQEDGVTLVGSERMWVQVDLIGDGIYGGTLRNNPELTKKIKRDSRIWFKPEHILDITYLNGTTASDMNRPTKAPAHVPHPIPIEDPHVQPRSKEAKPR